MSQDSYILKPSQWIKLGYILFGIIAFLLVIPFLIMIYRVLNVCYWQYHFFEDHVIERRWAFSVTRRELYYPRIKDIQQEAPFLYRLLGISLIQLVSSDPFSSFFQFTAIPKGLEFSEALRDLFHTGRKKNNNKELDLFHL